MFTKKTLKSVLSQLQHQLKELKLDHNHSKVIRTSF